MICCLVLYSLYGIVQYSSQGEESVSQAGHDSSDSEVEEEGDSSDGQEVRQPYPPLYSFSPLTHCRIPSLTAPSLCMIARASEVLFVHARSYNVLYYTILYYAIL